MSQHSDRIVALYERHAHHYDADRSRDLAVERRWLDRFLALLPPGAAVLDIGCGHGEPLYHASLSSLEYSRLLEANGFSVREHVVEDPDCGLHTVWLARATHSLQSV